MNTRTIATAAALALPVLLAGCGGGTAPAASPVITVTAPAPVQSATPTTAAPVKRVTLPAVKGRNGAIVQDELRALGLSNVELASGDETATVVLVPANWTATKIEPAAGTEVTSNATVVVTLTKAR